MVLVLTAATSSCVLFLLLLELSVYFDAKYICSNLVVPLALRTTSYADLLVINLEYGSFENKYGVLHIYYYVDYLYVTIFSSFFASSSPPYRPTIHISCLLPH